MGRRRAERRRGRRAGAVASPGRRRAAGPPPRRRPARSRQLSRRALGWIVVFAVLVVAGVTVPGQLLERTSEPAPDSPAGPERRQPSTLQSPTAPADLSALPIARRPFCGRIDDRYAAAALGGQVDARTSYRPGDRVSLGAEVSDVAHEFGCVFRAGDAEARVWVFAAPLDEREAEALVDDERERRGCRRPDDTLQYGTPGVVGVCPLPDGQVQVTARGLYDDTWLSCQLTVGGRPDDVLARAETWCLHVATALGARP